MKDSKKDLTETEIRTRYILPAIQQAQWTTDQIGEERFITDGEITVVGKVVTRGKRKKPDYILYFKPNIPIAVVEAKDNTHSVGEGIQQALDYSRLLNVMFVFSSNGDGFVFHDRTGLSTPMESNLSLEEFPTPSELWSRYRSWKKFSTEEERVVLQDYYADKMGKIPRYYQTCAINHAIESIAQGNNRILLVLATGTGKTYTAFQIIWRLWNVGLKKRILFLADRNVLIDQTKVNEFYPFGSAMTKLSTRSGTIERNRNGKITIDRSHEIYLSLYQAITGPEEHQKTFRQFSPDFFDLIIIDECHRGSVREDSAWREILEYFNSATQIGLTATPRETEYASNISYFGEPIYTYSLKQGILDGFLAPYKVVKVHIDRDIEGYRPEIGTVDREGTLVENREYTIRDFDRTLVIDERTKLVASKITTFLKESGDPYQKSIIFCVDQEHASRMRQALVNENADLVAEDLRYVMRITGADDVGQAELSNFMDPESKFPVLVTTSRLLSTGVDVQTCRLIVLDRTVGSMTEFKQIVGRGTRVHEDTKKYYFTLIDFRGATSHFSDPDFDGEPVQIYEPKEGDPINPPDNKTELDQENQESSDAIERDPRVYERRKKIYVDGVQVEILAERVEYLDKTGKLVTESLRDFTKKELRKQFASLDEFLKSWSSARRKQAVLDEMAGKGLPLNVIATELRLDLDPFDLVCYIAFDIKPLTRHERVANLRKQSVLSTYSKQAREVLEALIDKYADEGVLYLDDTDLLKIHPINTLGTPVELVKVFGGKPSFEEAVCRVQSLLYKEAA